MKGKSAVLGLLAAGWAAVAPAQQAGEQLTGVYRKDGAELAVLQGDNETLLYYGAGFPQGQSVGTCECPLVLQKKDSATRWSLKSTDSEDTWTLRLEPGRLSLTGGSPECCGAGWPGEEAFSRQGAVPPRTCKVKAPRAYFHAPDARNTQRKAFVVAGDTVQAFVPAIEPDFVPARFAAKRVTVGMLRREQLECQPQQGSAPAASASTVDVKPIAGRWVAVDRKGKGFILNEYCDANVPSIDIKAPGVLNIDYGQEDEEVEVKGLKPGAAGAYSVDVQFSGGQRETLAWKVVDAKRSVIELRGRTQYFAKGQLYVREDKKGGIPVKKEKCEPHE
ncbi:hypothetical protein HPC49_10520 [Pyxidicoccus fallax]|uniref:Lipoprotein n=1 Tax=Pyxidicoccus fallax TaxID=394095 RepID=A0A848LU83_9BACT|nr:hypothetical protein [Pyxidicoccus fallax]NMO21180.1 hypothetical protein [Pyxidicoccus fallax]NPC78677.1 hypothetical protein [Pyxidicoccus fallax]